MKCGICDAKLTPSEEKAQVCGFCAIDIISHSKKARQRPLEKEPATTPRKVRLTDETISIQGTDIKLYRIECIEKIVTDTFTVEPGQKGGWVEGLHNIADNAWVADEAKAFNKSLIKDNARLTDNATMWENSELSGNAHMSENSEIGDNAKMRDYAKMSGNAKMYGNSRMSGRAHMTDTAMLLENASVSGDNYIAGNSRIVGNTILL